MTNWLALHFAALRHAARRLARTPLGTALSALVVAIALLLPALGYVLADSVAQLASSLSGQPEISIFMEMNADSAQTQNVAAKLRGDPGVSALRFVPRNEALQALASDASFGDVAATLGNNPLPDAYVITPRSDSGAEFERLRDSVSKLPGVAHVQLDTEWVQRLAALVALGRLSIAILAALLGIALVIVTFNTIRLQILTQRQEIGVSLLLGATRPWVRRPFLYFGALQGALGGLLAWALLLIILELIRAPTQQLADAYGIPLMLSNPGTLETLALIALAGALGWLGAALSVRRHLHDRLVTD
ncbi:MAG: permease-like cell division protein FtsX [Betaproteobacteria bacterium]|nr:permease-like cell division protein FtsX [Betaproteobacteria bacterium]